MERLSDIKNTGFFDKDGNQVSYSEIFSKFITFDLEEVTRVEVIDSNGRSYTNWNSANKILISFQDDGRTLKIFIQKN